MTGPSVLYLAEGNSETVESWSGCSLGLVRAMRGEGATVRTVDVLPRSLSKWVSMALSFHPNRERWAARYHSGPVGVAMRSRTADRAIQDQPAGGAVIQAGATFSPRQLQGRPLFIYCDANAKIASRGAPYSSVSGLTAQALTDTIEKERRIYQQATGIFTFSEIVRRSFIDDLAIPAANVRAVGAGSNLHVTPGDDVLDDRWQGPPTILFVGKAFERKGGPDLLAAFALVRQAIPTARLLVAGGVELPPTEGVEVVGYVDPTRTGPGSLNELYRRADLFCMPSRYEPFGVVFAEAMLHGLPCVGANAWAMPEIIQPEVTGWLAPPGDVPALARILISALHDRPRLQRMGAGARQVAVERFSWRRVAKDMLADIREMSGRAG